jgi:hypothetical protein
MAAVGGAPGVTVDATRDTELCESGEELAEVASAARRLGEELQALYERADRLSRPAWAAGWSDPVAQLLPLSWSLAEWAGRLEALRGPA